MPITRISATLGPFFGNISGTTYVLPEGITREAFTDTLFDDGTADISWQLDGRVVATSSSEFGAALLTQGEDASVHVSSTGEVNSVGAGVRMDGDGGFFRNDGTVTGGTSGVVLTGENISALNTGRIEGGFFGFGSDNLTFFNTGEIIDDTGRGLSLAAIGPTFVHNTGIIRGTTEGYENSSNSSTSHVLINEGTISATNGPRAIDGGNPRNWIVNSGTLLGNVSLDAGDDYFNTREGTVSGIVSARAATIHSMAAASPTR